VQKDNAMTDGKAKSIKEGLDTKKTIDEMEQDLNEMMLQNNEYLKQLKDQHDEIQELRILLIAAEQGDASVPVKNKPAKSNQKQQEKQEPLSAFSEPGNSISSASSAKIYRLESQIYELRNSYAFRIGQILVFAIKKPGINTIMAPFRLTKLVFNSIFNRENA
jgi:hypothetical protein